MGYNSTLPLYLLQRSSVALQARGAAVVLGLLLLAFLGQFLAGEREEDAGSLSLCGS